MATKIDTVAGVAEDSHAIACSDCACADQETNIAMEPLSEPFDRAWSCPACAAPHAEPVWPNEPPRSHGGGADQFRLCRCRACQLVFTVPRLTAEEVAAYYPAEYYGDRNARFNPVMERLTRWFRQRRASTLTRLAKRGKVLDIGCGRGLTLAELRRQGWETEGVELSENAAHFARNVLNLDVTVGGFDPTRYPDNYFDAVIIWHVLEHVPEVMPTLGGIARILKPGGVLALAVPNFASRQAQRAGYDWFHLDLPRHYWHFTETWLTKTLAPLGLRVVHASHASLEQNPYGWIQSVLNHCGLRHNLLYDLLRSRSARAVADPWRSYPLQSLLSLVGLAALLPLSLVKLLLEAFSHNGGTVELYAVKE